MIRVYGFATGLADVPAIAGVGGGALTAIDVSDIAAVVSSEGGEPTSDADVIRHGEIVDALADAADAVLPARFGEIFPDRDELVLATTRRLGALRDRLAFVRGHVEMTVRIRSRDGAATAGAADGAAYMLERLRVQDADVGSIHEDLRPTSREAVVHQRVDGMYRASFLVREEDVASFAARLDRWVEARPHVAAVCTGPWPPYSFAELG